MKINIDIIYLEPPETARYVQVAPSSAQYLVYTSNSSVLPCSFDQVQKNNVLIAGSGASNFNVFGPSSAALSDA